LRQQLRAMILAASGRHLRIMFPMIAEVSEFVEARKILDAELNLAEARGQVMPAKLDVGTMLEVPALMWQLPALLSRIDFLSIGSNDLLQFLFACDRGSPRLSDRYDTLSPAVLNFFRDLSRRTANTGVTVTVCGEMAGRPLEAMALIGLGLRSLSMSAGSIGPVKAMTRSLDAHRLTTFLDHHAQSPHRSLRTLLKGYARDHGVVI